VKLSARASWALHLGACIAALTLASATSAEPERLDPNVARRITVEDVKKHMESGEKIVFVDTRGVSSGPAIKDAIQVPKGEIASFADKLPRDGLIVCYCT
jgi:rhodanese-related sulfurtransferase